MLDTSGQDRVVAVQSWYMSKYIKIGMAAAALVLIVLFLSVTLPAAQRLTSSDLAVSRDQLRIASVQLGNLQRDIAVDGTVVASNSPGIYAPTGGIIKLFVKSGEPVTTNQMLAKIDSPELESQLIQEQASLEQAKLELERQEIQTKNTLANLQNDKELAEVNLELEQSKKNRADQSIASQIISREDYELRIAELKKAEFEFKHAERALELQQENLEFELNAQRFQVERQQYVVDNLARQVQDLDLLSPIDGVVGNVYIRERDNVAANALLITLVDLTTLEVDLSIPENYADDLGIGMRAEINYNGNIRQGELISISPEVEEGFVRGRMSFIDSYAGLRQNQRVSVRILIEEKNNILKVRNGAFVESGGGRIAYVLRGDDTAELTDIRVGVRSISEVEVASGLQEGDRIIISSLDRFNGVDKLLITD
ncbi:MAG: HlyD family efflux transporter periplasmic adaptor subunit [Wenzhouxiangellaceae bacterium]